MAGFSRDEVDAAFRRYWRTGAVGEDWEAWAQLFTSDALYVEHVLGDRYGAAAIRDWIVPTMAKYPELYTVYEWHVVDESGRAVVAMQNRRDHPSGRGVIDFPGVTILQYAGDGLFSYEEDYWAVPRATAAAKEYIAACREHDPGHPQRMTRLDWGRGPEWTRGARSFADRPKRTTSD
jgi:hypothetical protein